MAQIQSRNSNELGKCVCYHARMTKSGNIIITHHSAASYWLHADLDKVALADAECDPLADCARDSKALKRFDTGFPGFGARPVHLLVDDKRLIRSTRTIITHVSTIDLPSGSFVRLREGLYVSSPELCIVQMARYLTGVQLTELAMNLCASYFIHPLTGEIHGRKNCLATLESLAEYANKSSLRGSRKVVGCLPLAIADSRSPVETKLSILLRQHPGRGGEGFTGHVLNHHVDAADYVDIAEQGKFYIDVAYEEPHVGVEYYGEEYHKDTAKDRRRINALRALGWNVLTLEKQQLYDPKLFALFANQLSTCLGVKVSHPWDWEAKNKKLRYELGIA